MIAGCIKDLPPTMGKLPNIKRTIAHNLIVVVDIIPFLLKRLPKFLHALPCVRFFVLILLLKPSYLPVFRFCMLIAEDVSYVMA